MKQKNGTIQKIKYRETIWEQSNPRIQYYHKNLENRINTRLCLNYRKIGRQYLQKRNQQYQIEKLSLKLYGVEEFRYRRQAEKLNSFRIWGNWEIEKQNRDSFTQVSLKKLKEQVQAPSNIASHTNTNSSIVSYKSIQPLYKQTAHTSRPFLRSQLRSPIPNSKIQPKKNIKQITSKPKKSSFFNSEGNIYINQLIQFKQCLGSSDQIDSLRDIHPKIANNHKAFQK